MLKLQSARALFGTPLVTARAASIGSGRLKRSTSPKPELELWCRGLPLSLAEAYVLLLRHCSPEAYQVYSYLRRLGYVVLPSVPIPQLLAEGERHIQKKEQQKQQQKTKNPPQNEQLSSTNTDVSQKQSGKGLCLQGHKSDITRHKSDITIIQSQISELDLRSPSPTNEISVITAPPPGKQRGDGKVDLATVRTMDDVYTQLRSLKLDSPPGAKQMPVATTTLLHWDVYVKSRGFKVTLRGPPDFRVYVCRALDAFPSLGMLRTLLLEAEGIPLRIATSHGGLVSFFMCVPGPIPILSYMDK